MIRSFFYNSSYAFLYLNSPDIYVGDIYDHETVGFNPKKLTMWLRTKRFIINYPPA